MPSVYYNFLNDDNDDGNNIPGAPVDDSLPENKGVKDAVVKNDENFNYEIIIDDDDSLASDIHPLQNKVMVIEEVGNETEGKEMEEVDSENEEVEN